MKNKRLPVIMCVYKRLDHLELTLNQLLDQVDYTFDIFIWNNNPKEQSRLERTAELYPQLKITVHHSKSNIGGFGRFYLARQISSRYPAVIFIDDDVDLSQNALSTLAQEFKPRTIHSFYAFKFKTKDNYFKRKKLKPGNEADYCGTGGMICDTSIFNEKGLFECPKEYWFIEDLWLSYYANHILGWKLYKSGAKIILVEDGKNQWIKLKISKTAFLKYLIFQGWNVGNASNRFYDQALARARQLFPNNRIAK